MAIVLRQNGNFYFRVSHRDTEWKVYERMKKGTQLTCIDTTAEYRPTKHSVPVRIHTSAGRKICRELGAELKIDNELPEGPVESFKQLIVDQPAWIKDLIDFVTFAPDQHIYNQMATKIHDVLKAHNEDVYLLVVSDGSVKHLH